MLALCSILSYTYYAQNYAGMISWSLSTHANARGLGHAPRKILKNS